MAVACVCYVGRQNEPLCLRVYGEAEELSMQFAAYAALDVIDEQRTTQDACLYAYVAPTGLKILVGLALRGPLHEQELRAVGRTVFARELLLAVRLSSRVWLFLWSVGLLQFFKRLHRLYADAISNPFFLGTIETPRFIQQLDAIVEHYTTKVETA